jgi:hypothetical protein
MTVITSADLQHHPVSGGGAVGLVRLGIREVFDFSGSDDTNACERQRTALDNRGVVADWSERQRTDLNKLSSDWRALDLDVEGSRLLAWLLGSG